MTRVPADDDAGVDAPDDRELIAATERWFLKRGLPHFIDDYRAGDDVLTRALPVLLAIFVLGLFGAANLEWRWWQNLLALVAAAAVVTGGWAVVNRSRGRRWSQLPDHVGPVEVAAFLLVPSVLPLLFGGQVGVAAGTFATNLIALAAIYLITSYGLIPMTRWAYDQTMYQVGTVVGLMGRALPLLLLFGVALFINTEVWQVAAALDGLLFWSTIGFFVLVGTSFLLVRLPAELARLRSQLTGEALTEACASSPLAEVACDVLEADRVPLSKRQQGNVLLVLFFSQAVQIALVTLIITTFFLVFGMLAIRPEVVATWLGELAVEAWASWEFAGRTFELTQAHLRVAGFLGALSGFYFTVYVITDATYRQEFFTEIVDEVRQSLAVRDAYLGLINRRSPAPPAPPATPGEPLR
jgi:hypothetical protein